jgi:hypothetical protein
MVLSVTEFAVCYLQIYFVNIARGLPVNSVRSYTLRRSPWLMYLLNIALVCVRFTSSGIPLLTVLAWYYGFVAALAIFIFSLCLSKVLNMKLWCEFIPRRWKQMNFHYYFMSFNDRSCQTSLPCSTIQFQYNRSARCSCSKE